ncbi:MAG: hypothetical protein ABI560_03455 [Myxococcales bacterium]
MSDSAILVALFAIATAVALLVRRLMLPHTVGLVVAPETAVLPPLEIERVGWSIP